MRLCRRIWRTRQPGRLVRILYSNLRLHGCWRYGGAADRAELGDLDAGTPFRTVGDVPRRIRRRQAPRMRWISPGAIARTQERPGCPPKSIIAVAVRPSWHRACLHRGLGQIYSTLVPRLGSENSGPHGYTDDVNNSQVGRVLCRGVGGWATAPGLQAQHAGPFAGSNTFLVF